MKSMRLGFAGCALLAMAGAPHAFGSVAEGGECGGFTAADAAAWLKAPAGQVARHVSKAGDRWLCSFAVGKSAPGIAYSVAVAASSKRAADDLERYRDDLAAASETAAWKGKLPQCVYSDIFGAGDEGVWTDINGTLTVRRGNVTLQFTLPREKLEQVKLGKTVAEKF